MPGIDPNQLAMSNMLRLGNFGLSGPRPDGSNMLTGMAQPQATPPFLPNGQQNPAYQQQQQQSQQQGNEASKEQQSYIDKYIIPGYYMGQMASAMGGGPAGGALAGAASQGLNMLFNYFQGKYRPDTYGEGAPVGHDIPSTSTQYGDD